MPNQLDESPLLLGELEYLLRAAKRDPKSAYLPNCHRILRDLPPVSNSTYTEIDPVIAVAALYEYEHWVARSLEHMAEALTTARKRCQEIIDGHLAAKDEQEGADGE